MPDEFDPYKPGTGLKDDFIGAITDAVFAPDPQTGNCKAILMTVDEAGEEYPVNYWLGSGWDTYDGGATVQHPGGDRQLFSNQSQYSDFMVHAMEAGAKDVMYDRLRAGLGPRVAANWLGMKFQWDSLQRPTRRPKVDAEGQPVADENGRQVWENTTTARLLPTKFMGLVGVQGTLEGVAGAGTVASAPSATTNDPLTVLDAVTAAKVRAAAKEAGDYGKFIDAMLALNDTTGTPIMEHAEIGQAVADEGWFTSLHDS